MANVTITQLPVAIGVNGSADYIEISQYAGPPVGYISRRILPKTLSGPGAFMTSGTFTLTPNATSTIVPVTGCLPTSKMPLPCPLYEGTGHAANDIPTTSYTMGTNQFTINHASNSRTDRTFMFVLFY